jgi:hypothetical protein
MAARKAPEPKPTKAGDPRVLSTNVMLDNGTFLAEGSELPEEYASLVGEHALVPAEAAAAEPVKPADPAK